jgi:hypothetical protein
MAAPKCCAREIQKHDPSGQAANGERWKCPKCGREWEHECDEAEGCTWFPVNQDTDLVSNNI